MGDKERRIVRKGNVVHIYQPEGAYTIRYVAHEPTYKNFDFLEKIFPPTEVLPSHIPDIQGLFLEGPFNYLEAPLYYLESLKSRSATRQIFPLLEEKRIPVYLAEVAFADTSNPPLIYTAEFGLVFLELLMGAHIASKARPTRRDLLKFSISVGLASYLSSPFISLISHVVSAYTEVGNEQAARFQELTQKVNPSWFFSLTFRELVLAHKQIWQAERLAKKPHFLTIIGGAHSGLERQYQSTAEERLNTLERLKPFWKPQVEPETFYKMVRFDFNGERWKVGEIIEVPELKRMV